MTRPCKHCGRNPAHDSTGLCGLCELEVNAEVVEMLSCEDDEQLREPAKSKWNDTRMPWPSEYFGVSVEDILARRRGASS